MTRQNETVGGLPALDHTNWAQFRGNRRQTGNTDDAGPLHGRIKWKTPCGRQWYSPPLVEKGRVYQACPGRIGEKLICLDLASGRTIWSAAGTKEPQAGQLPSNLRMSSRIISAGNMLYVRGLNHDGIFEIRKDDGCVQRTFDGDGILDYRTHPGPMLAGNSQVLIYPLGTQFHAGPTLGQTASRIWRHIGCRELSTGEIRWRFHVGQFFGEPAIDDQHVFVGTDDGYLFCLDLETPDPLSTEIGTTSASRVAWSYQVGAPVNGSPLVVGDQVIFGANNGIIYALSVADGRPIWHYATGQVQANAFIQFSKPTHHAGTIFVGDASGRVHAIDACKGDAVGSFSMEDWVRASPAVSDERIVVASLDSTVACFAPDGSSHWRRRLGHWHLTCDPVIAEDRVLIVTSDMMLHCLSLSAGEICWQRALVDYPNDWVAFDEFQSSPAVADGTLYVGSPGRFLHALDVESGKPRWRHEVGGEVPSDPLCVDGRVYFGQYGGDGTYFCADAQTGEIIWTQKLGTVWAASNQQDGRLFVPTAEGNAYCLDAQTGAILWQSPLASDLYMGPAIDRDLVYFGAWDNWLYALHTQTGELAWKFNAETYLDSGAPAIADGRLYLPTMGPRFYCLDSQTGEVIWTFDPDPSWTTNASPAIHGDKLVMTVFISGGMPWTAYEIQTYCLNAHTGNVNWVYPAGGLNGPTIARDRVYFGSTSRGDFGFYCLDLTGTGDGTTTCLFRVELGFNMLESCAAIVGDTAYVYAEDGYVYAIE